MLDFKSSISLCGKLSTDRAGGSWKVSFLILLFPRSKFLIELSLAKAPRPISCSELCLKLSSSKEGRAPRTALPNFPRLL